jgi:predicted O-methyltransferase YrrM
MGRLESAAGRARRWLLRDGEKERPMSEAQWNAVEDYICAHLVVEDPALVAAQAASAAAGLPDIAVSATQGKLLKLLAETLGARKILEIGTLGGYSSIWLARGLAPGGRLITLELDPKHAEVARANVGRAGLGDRVEIRVGAALDNLPQLPAEAPFDLIFIDADKQNNAAYFQWAVRLSRPGSLIVVDNVVRDGKVADAENTEPMVIGTRKLFAAISDAAADVEATAIQTVGPKGYDGFIVARVQATP